MPPMNQGAIDQGVEHVFSAALQFPSESSDDAIVTPERREGEYLGSGDGTVVGPHVNGSLRWSFYVGNCLYPQIRRGSKVSDALHLCTVSPGGLIDTDDGALVALEGRGYGLRDALEYRLSLTLTFSTDHPRDAWLNRALGIVDGTFDEATGRAQWRCYIPSRQLPRDVAR